MFGKTKARHGSTPGTGRFRPSHRPLSRAAAVLLSLSVAFTMMPTPAFAVTQEKKAGTGLCEHHLAHTAECGYQKAGEASGSNAGHPCEYVCDICGREEQLATDSNAGEKAAAAEVMDRIDALPTVEDIYAGMVGDSDPDYDRWAAGMEQTMEDIRAAREAYDALSDSDKELIGQERKEKLDDLTALVEALAERMTLEGTHTHAMSADCSMTDGTQMDFTEWTESGSLPSEGNYCLANDVTLADDWTLARDKELNLCLNGRTVTVNEGKHLVVSGKLQVCDCAAEAGGQITGSYGGGKGNSALVEIEGGGIIFLYGGKVFNDYSGGNPCHSAVSTLGGTLGIFGGEVKSNGYCAVYVDSQSNGVQLSGTPVITGESADEDIYLNLYQDPLLIITGPLSPPISPFRVSVNIAKTFTSGWSAHMGGQDFDSYFRSGSKGLFIDKNNDNELALIPYAVSEQPSADNSYSVTANGEPHYAPIAYQWFEAETRMDVPVTDTEGEKSVKATPVQNTSYNPETGYWTPQSGGRGDYFEIFLLKGDTLKITPSKVNNVPNYFIDDENGNRTVPDSSVDGIYTLRAPKDNSYTLGYGSPRNGEFIVKATVSGTVLGDPVAGQETEQLTGAEDGKGYLCQITYEDGTVIRSDVVTYEAAAAKPVWAARGDGTKESPYEIDTYEQLAAFGDNVNGTGDYAGQTNNFAGKYIKLAENFPTGGTATKLTAAIGNGRAVFCGSFNGNGRTVELAIDATEDYQGLFGQVTLGGMVENVNVTGKVTGGDCVGGLIGNLRDGTVQNCVNQAAVTGNYYVGGVAGYLQQGTVQNCVNQAAVTGNYYVGGVVGFNEEMYSSTTKFCYNIGLVSGKSNVGGVIGVVNRQSVKNCLSLGLTVTAADADSEAGRVAGKKFGGGLESNQARADMKVYKNINDPVTVTSDATGIHGADLAVDGTVTLSEAFSESAGWVTDIWEIPKDSHGNPVKLAIGCELPMLKALTGAAAPTLPGEAPEPAPTVDDTKIYANGLPLLLTEGTDKADGTVRTVIYIDKGTIGQLDDADEIFDPDEDGTAYNGTEAGNDLWSWNIYGGSKDTELTGDTKITMLGGNVFTICGGGGSGSKVTGSTSVTVTGGEVSTLYGGSHFDNNTVTGNVSVTVTGGEVTGGIAGSGNGTVEGEKNVTVGGEVKIASADSKGIFINGGENRRTAGVDHFVIGNDLTENASVGVELPTGYDITSNPTIATEAVIGDLEKIKIAGSGAKGMEAYFDSSDNTIKVKAAGPVTVTTLEALNAAIAGSSGTLAAPTVIMIGTEGISVTKKVAIDGKHVKLTGGALTRGESYQGNIIEVVNGGSLTLEAITLDGNQDNVTATATGSLVYVAGKFGNAALVSTLTIGSGAVLQNNTTTGKGGAVKLNDNGGALNFIMTDGLLTNNTSPSGGAIHEGGWGTTTVRITGGSITANTANGTDQDSTYAGAIYSNGTLIIEGGEITGNSVPNGRGGGIFKTGGKDRIFTVTGGTISGNTARTDKNRGDNVYVNQCAFTLGGTANIPNGLYLKLGSSSTFTIASTLENPVEIEEIYNNPQAGTVVAAGKTGNAPYTITEADLAKFSYKGDVFVFALDGNQIKLANPSYPVTFHLTGMEGKATPLPASVEKGKDLMLQLIASDGYKLPAATVSVKVGGTELNPANMDYQLQNYASACSIAIPANKITGAVEITAKASKKGSDAQLSALTYWYASDPGDVPVPGFSADAEGDLTYDVILPGSVADNKDIYVDKTKRDVNASSSDDPGYITLTNGTGSWTVTITSEDGSKSNTYTVNFKVQTKEPAFRDTSAAFSTEEATAVTFTLTNAVSNGTYKGYSAATGGEPLTDPAVSVSGDTLKLTFAGKPAEETSYYISVTDGGKAESVRTAVTVKPYEKPAPTVTGVTVTPISADVQKGSTRQFTAMVNGTNNPAQTVTWSVEGSHADGTMITEDGLLTVASDETQATLTVKAVSTVDTSKSGTATVTVTEAPPAPTYGISLSQSGTYTFAGAAAGYGEQTPLTVTVTNTGNQPTGPLNVQLAGETRFAFTLSSPATIDSIVPGGTATFTVQPVTGLLARIYTATVQVSGSSISMAGFSVSFEVSPAQQTAYTISGTITGSDTGSGIAAVLQLKDSENANVGAPVTAGADGFYTITGVPAGTYRIEVSLTGYDSEIIDGIVVSNGDVTGRDLTLHKTVTFIPVTDITMTNAATVEVNTDLALTGTVTPDNATNRTMVWTVVDAGGTGAVINGSMFRAATAGTATVKASIANGLTASTPYEKTFTITVTAEPVTTHTITASAGSGGTISPSGRVAVNEGESQTFTITPDSKYRISQVTVDGADKGAVAAYTFEHVTADHNISVTFRYIGGGSSGGGGSSSGGGSTLGGNSITIPSTTTSTTAGENGTTITTTQTTSKDSSGKTTTVTTEVTKDAAGNVTGSKTEVTTENIRTAAGEGSSLVTISPDASAINSGAQAAGASAGNPLEVLVNIPQETIAGELQKPEVNSVSAEIIIPKAVSDNPNIEVGVSIRKETIQAAKDLGKDLSVTVKDENGAARAIWNFDSQAMKELPGQAADVSVGLHTAPIQSDDPSAQAAKPLAAAMGSENGLVLTVNGSGVLPRAKLTVRATDRTGINPGDSVTLYRFDQVANRLVPVSGVTYMVDANGNVTVDLPAKDFAAGPERYVLLSGASATAAGRTYTIKKGDTLKKIAREHGCTVNELMSLNQVEERNLQIGQVIQLPAR